MVVRLVDRLSEGSTDDPPSLPVFQDDQLIGPLYGLPALDACHHRLVSAGFHEGITDIAAQRRTFELSLLSLRAIWNARLPIHTLPAEILLEVFKYSLTPERGNRSFKRPWARLMGVCRHWCALVRNATLFWSTVNVSGSTKWLDVSLRRSQGAPLRVTLSCDCDMEAAVSMLLQHADHIKDLKLNPLNSRVLNPLFDCSFPRLSNLTVCLDPQYSNGPSLDRTALLRIDNCPHLKSLTLTRFPLSWTKPLLANLQSLSLTDCESSTKPLSFAEFLDTLGHGQQLRLLHLHHFLSAALSTQASIPHGRLVTLPKLHTLHCRDVPVLISHLISHLHTPDDAHYLLIGEIRDADDDLSTSFAALLPQDLARRPFMRSIQSAYLSVGDTINELYWDVPSGAFCLLALHRAALWDGWLERGLRQLPALFSLDTTQLTSLTVCGDINTASPDAWDLVFDSFSALDTLILDVKEGGAFPTVITSSLSAPPSGEEEASCVRCSTLATLDISGWRWTQTDAENVLACLQARAAGGARKLDSLRLYPDFATLGRAEVAIGKIWVDHQQELCRIVGHFERW